MGSPLETWLNTNYHGIITHIARHGSYPQPPAASELAAAGVASPAVDDIAAMVLMRLTLGDLLGSSVSWFSGVSLAEPLQPHLIYTSTGPFLGMNFSGNTEEAFFHKVTTQQREFTFPVVRFPLDRGLLRVPALLERLGNKDFVDPRVFIRETIARFPENHQSLRESFALAAGNALQTNTIKSGLNSASLLLRRLRNLADNRNY